MMRIALNILIFLCCFNGLSAQDTIIYNFKYVGKVEKNNIKVVGNKHYVEFPKQNIPDTCWGCDIGIPKGSMRKVIYGIPHGDSLVDIPYFRPYKNLMKVGCIEPLGLTCDGDGNKAFYYTYPKFFDSPIPSKLANELINEIWRVSQDSFMRKIIDSLDLSGEGYQFRYRFSAVFDNDGSFKKLYLIQGIIDDTILPSSIQFKQVSFYNKVLNPNREEFYPKYIYFFMKNSDNGGEPSMPLYRGQRFEFLKKSFIGAPIPRLIRKPGRSSFYTGRVGRTFKHDVFSKSFSPNNIEDFFYMYQKEELKFKTRMPDFFARLDKNLKKMPKLTPIPKFIFKSYEYLYEYDSTEKFNWQDPNDYYGFSVDFELESNNYLLEYMQK